MKKLIVILVVGLFMVSCTSSAPLSSSSDCECDVAIIHDTVFIPEVRIRYGTRDTIYVMYPIDSAEVSVGYLKSNGAFNEY